MQDRTMKRARVEIIPLIDVIFFLLATFVLFTLSLNKHTVIPLTMPSPCVGCESTDQVVNLRVATGDVLFWNDEPISRAELPARLAHYKSTTMTPRVFVEGEATASFGDTVGALDDVRASGIKSVSMKTQPASTVH